MVMSGQSGGSTQIEMNDTPSPSINCIIYYPSKQLQLMCRNGPTYHLGLPCSWPVHKCSVSLQLCSEAPCTLSISPSPNPEKETTALISKYTVKLLNFRHKKLCCNSPKIQTKRPNLRVFPHKDANGIANSEDPDQTAPGKQSDLGLHCLPRPVCPKT